MHLFIRQNPILRVFQLLLTAFSLLLVPAARAVTSVGNITGATVTTNGAGNITASFALSSGGSVEITPYDADVVRVDFHWVGPFETEQIMIDKPLDQWPAAGATFSDQGSHYLIQTAELDVEVEKTPYKVHFKDKSGYYLLQDDFTEYEPSYNFTGQSGDTTSKMKCRKIAPSSQAFFGLGEYGGPLNRRGRTLECWNTGTYNWGEFTNPTYLNIPFFYGVQPAESGNPAFVYGLFFHNSSRPKFKFGTEQADRYSFQAGDGRMDYFFFGGGVNHSMADVIDGYSELIGRPTMLPKWGLGYHLSRFSYANQPWVENVANEATNQDVPLDAVYLDIDYMDANGDNNIGDGQLRQLTFNFNFPNPAGMISYCNTRGVQVVPLIEPWLEPGDSLHGEANSNLHFIKDNGGNTVTRNIYVGAVSWFDYTSSSMQSWWGGKINNWMSGLNFGGIWNDLTEPEGGDQIPHDALMWQDGKYGDQNDSRRHWKNERNYFGLRASQQSYNAMLAADSNRRPFILGRSGNAGLQRYAVSWSGDTAANWFYHQKTIRFGMGAMIAGVAWYGNDVGGFAGSPNGELMVRSTEANFLTPFFRNHADKGAADREPWQFGSTDLGHQRDLIKLRYRMMPYLYTLAYEATQTGEPMNVPAVFDFYEDPNTHSLNDYEYLVGDSILCAPVYNQGANNRSVYLPYAPDVEWYYWPSGNASSQSFDGGQTVSVSAPLGDAPLFVKSGAIIPMGPSMQYANEFQSGWMDINCWPKGDSEFTLHEDDGETWDYLGGEYAQTRFVSSRTESDWDLTIEARQGTYDPGTRDFYVYCFNPGTSVVQAVYKDGALLPEVTEFNSVAEGWLITAEGRIGIKVPGNGAQIDLNVDFGGGVDTVQHAWPTYFVPEDGGFARILVSRNGDATGTVSVAFATADGTGVAGFDYTATNATLNWGPGDTGSKFFDVFVADDGIYTGDRTFTAILSNPMGADLGSPTLTTVTIVEDDPIPPDLLITDPATDITVGHATTNYTVQGIANAFNWAGLSWSNALTGAVGSVPIDFSWSVDGIGLDIGTNVITVTATNVSGVGASDHATNAAYSGGWSDGDNGGNGWAGGWDLVSGGSSGFFIADGANSNSSAGIPAWGLYGNSGGLADAQREFASPLVAGQVLSFRFDNNWVQNGGSVGIGLQNAAGMNLFEFYFEGGDQNYTIHDSAGERDSGIPWSGDGWDISFELTSGTDYEVNCGGNVVTGSLSAEADQNIALFRTWNFNAGSTGNFDFFLNDLSLSSSGSSPSTSAVVRIVRAPESVIPQAWRDLHNLTGLNSGDEEDKEGDGLDNLTEYLMDSDPNQTNAPLEVVIVNAPIGDVAELMAGPVTTNSRVYDLFYSTNLVSESWVPSVQGVPGNGAVLPLTTTNSEAEVFFRTGVRVP